MKIIIVGAGLTGTELAKKLVSEKNNVVLIDNNEETVRHVSNRLDCMVIHADGNSLDTLEEAGIAKADALILLTNSDEVNMITCSLVEAIYPQVMKIARVRNYKYYVKTKKTQEYKELAADGEGRPLYGIDHMVYPDREASVAILRAIEHGPSPMCCHLITRTTKSCGCKWKRKAALTARRCRTCELLWKTPSCWFIWRTRPRPACLWVPPSFRQAITWEFFLTRTTWTSFCSFAATTFRT